MGFVYQADVYCDDCGEKIRQEIHNAGWSPEDSMDQSSYDSGDFPKSADVENEESDSPNHCAKCGDFLRNPLTSDGYQYVKETLDQTGQTHASRLSETLYAWMFWYNFTYWDAEDCADDLLGKHPAPGWYSSEAF